MPEWVAYVIMIAIGILIDRLVLYRSARRRRLRRTDRLRMSAASTPPRGVDRRCRRDRPRACRQAGRPPVLLADATGFHGHAYLPVAAHLGPHFHTFALDFRGHGDTPLPADWTIGWEGYGDDALAAARGVAALPGNDGGLVGFGHSMGGTALLMAALDDPGLFRLLVLFEPIVVPTDRPRPAGGPNELSEGARRRRPVFDSFDAAIANYASKPPMAAFDPTPSTPTSATGSARGRSHPTQVRSDTEADTFDNGANHRTFDRLGEIATPVVVLAGASEDMRPSAFAPDSPPPCRTVASCARTTWTTSGR